MTENYNEKNNDIEKYEIDIHIDDASSGERFDKFLASQFPEVSRSRVQNAIENGDIVLNNKKASNKQKIQYGDHAKGTIRTETVILFEPENILLDIIYEDETLLVVNKPVGLVVHPGAGNPSGTLLNGLLHHVPHANTLPRAGIVHRLDKDTSGLLVVAKTHEAQLSLIQQLQERSVSRTYRSLVYGEFISSGTINLPIGRDPRDRLKMKVTTGGKEAITHYKVKERFEGLTLLEINLETGRTHQIRVHMTHEKHSLIGDKTYGRPKPPKGLSKELREQLLTFPRQCLHAKKLSFIHPATEKTVRFNCELPDDIHELLENIREEAFVTDNKDMYFWNDPAYGVDGEEIDEH